MLDRLNQLSHRFHVKSLHSHLILYFICALLILAPSVDLVPVLSRYDEKRFLECVLLLLVVVQLLTRPKLLCDWITQFNHFSQPTQLMLAGLLGLGLVSSLLATNSRMALLEVSLYYLLFIGCLYIATHYRRLGPQFGAILSNTILTAAGVMLLTFTAALLAASTTGLPLLHQELFGNFSHIRFFSQLQSWTLPLIVLPLMLVNRCRRAHYALLLFIACGWWLLALTTGTRGTLLGMAVAALVVALAFGQHSKTWFKWQALALLGGLLLYLCLFILPTLVSGGETNAVQDGSLHRSITHPSGRFHLWEIALNMVKANPWLGAGPMHYACGTNQAAFAAHPHNAVLQIAAEWGLPAALLVILLFIWGMTAWIRQGRQLLAGTADRTDKAFLYPVLLASLTAAATHALFSGIIIMPLSQLMLMVIVGWMLGLYANQNDQADQTKITKRSQLFWFSLFILAALGLLQGVLPALADFGELLNLAQKPEQANIFAPRFWQQGLFCP